MKIRCEFCGNYFNDTLTNCPSCGASNNNVNKPSLENPTTIEGLKEWYKSKNLPPYEVTRFFIGMDYRQPRAFGIYKNDYSGKFVVYKNKDNGQRAIRYEGDDEAFAVNELLMRLKQEILSQKALNAQKTGNTDKTINTEKPVNTVNTEKSPAVTSTSNPTPANTSGVSSLSYFSAIDNSESAEEKAIKTYKSIVLTILAILVAMFGLFGLITAFSKIKIFPDTNPVKANKDPEGYYLIYGNAYYYSPNDQIGLCYFDEKDDRWYPVDQYDYASPECVRNATFLSKEWKDSYAFSPADFSNDNLYTFRSFSKPGYYYYNDQVYYKFDYDLGWMCYDTKSRDWFKVYVGGKDKLTYRISSDQYACTEDILTEKGVPEISERDIFELENPNNRKDNGYYNYNDTTYYYYDYNNTDYWYSYSYTKQDWEKVSDDKVPSDLKDAYTAQDFYYTPVWNSNTQITDFADSGKMTEIHQDYDNNHKTYSSGSSSGKSSFWDWDSDSWGSDSSDYSWSSSSSWDSGSTDWSSDW